MTWKGLSQPWGSSARSLVRALMGTQSYVVLCLNSTVVRQKQCSPWKNTRMIILSPSSWLSFVHSLVWGCCMIRWCYQGILASPTSLSIWAHGDLFMKVQKQLQSTMLGLGVFFFDNLLQLAVKWGLAYTQFFPGNSTVQLCSRQIELKQFKHVSISILRFCATFSLVNQFVYWTEK